MSTPVLVQIERWHQFADEILPLWQAHYREIAWKQTSIALEVDVDRYQALDNKGRLKCFIARDESGSIIGYAGWLLSHHLHYRSHLIAHNDVLYVDPKHRGRGLLKQLLNASESHFKEIGADVVTLHIKSILDWGVLAERQGYERVETVYHKWIGA